MPQHEGIREIGVTEQTFYRWKKKYCEMPIAMKFRHVRTGTRLN